MDRLFIEIGEYSGKDIGRNFEIVARDFFFLYLPKHFQIGESGWVKNHKGIPSWTDLGIRRRKEFKRKKDNVRK